MTSTTNDHNAQHYFDAAKDASLSGELVRSFDRSASSPELQATRQKSDDLKEQQQHFSKVLSGAMDPSESAYNITNTAQSLGGGRVNETKKGSKKDSLNYILTMQAINRRIADLDAGDQAFQGIFDKYSDDDIREGKHLDENGKFKDPKAEEYWQKYCEEHGLDPDDPELRRNPDMLHSVQDWIQDEKKEARAIRDHEFGQNRVATLADEKQLIATQKNYEASYEVAKEVESAENTSEEQELEDFEKIRSEGLMSGDSEGEILEAERAQFETLSEGAKEILRTYPEKKYLFEEKNNAPENSVVSEQPQITTPQYQP